jgi:hypothetical protein
VNNGVNQWLRQHCVRHPRISGGAVVLLRYINMWLRKNKQRPCSFREFEAVLAGEGLKIVAVNGTLLIPGMGLKVDAVATGVVG